MNFLQPAYLWALTALAVPLAIHLLSRKEGKIIRMGSLRHVRETPTRQFRSIRLNEYVLLALRMTVVALVVLLMSGWYLDNLSDHTRWAVIEPGLEQRSDLVPLLDSLDKAGYQRRWLSPGFPEADAAPTPFRQDYPARVEELRRLSVNEVVIVASNKQAGFSGPRVSLPDHVRWIDAQPSPTKAAVSRIRVGKDSVQVREGTFTATATSYTTYTMVGTAGRPRDTVALTLAVDPDFETDRNTLAVVLDVIRENSADAIRVSQVPAKNFVSSTRTDWVFWLSASPPPTGTTPVIVVAGGGGRNIIEQVSRSRYHITERLNSETVVSRNLAAHLASLLTSEPEALRKADSLDTRSLPMPLAFSTGVSGANGPAAATGNRASSQYLVIALLVALLLERFIAYRRNQ